MTYKNKTDFIRNHNVRRLGIVEYCLGLERQGLDDQQIQAKMIIDNVVNDFDAVSLYPSAMYRMDGFLKGVPNNVSKSPRSVQDNFSFYKKISKQIGWVK